MMLPHNRDEAPPGPAVSNHVRILYVDNDESFGRVFLRLLNYWGYQIFVAPGQGQALLKNAIAMAHRHRCHIALVDMRLMDNSSRDDISGLELVGQLKPTESIILSAFPDSKTIRESTHAHGAFAFLGKVEDPSIIQSVIEDAARKYSAEFRGVRCEPAEMLSRYRHYFYPEEAEIPENEVSEVLARLFPRAHRLQVKELESTGRQSQSQAPRPRSKVLLVTADDLQPQIVKLARAAKIKIEVDRYQQYIAERLVGNFSPPIREWAVLWDMGGAVYPFLGSRGVDQFSHFYRRNTAEKILQTLRQFFTETWSQLYQDARKNSSQKVSIFKAYCDVWDENWYCDRLNKIEFPLIDHPAIGRNMASAPNPIEWLKHRVSHPEEMPTTALAVTHGDLHGANMLVDQNNYIWGIDFERSGPGPILQDFVELETDIILRLSGLKRDDFRGLYELGMWAARRKSLLLNRDLKLERQVSSEIRKTMQVIVGLRRIAAQCSGESDARPYLWGLLLNALFRASLLKGRGNLPQLRRALMLSSILCLRLDNWARRWPPPVWDRQ